MQNCIMPRCTNCVALPCTELAFCIGEHLFSSIFATIYLFSLDQIYFQRFIQGVIYKQLSLKVVYVRLGVPGTWEDLDIPIFTSPYITAFYLYCIQFHCEVKDKRMDYIWKLECRMDYISKMDYIGLYLTSWMHSAKFWKYNELDNIWKVESCGLHLKSRMNQMTLEK